MKCPNCNKEIINTAKFCSFCGESTNIGIIDDISINKDIAVQLFTVSVTLFLFLIIVVLFILTVIMITI